MPGISGGGAPALSQIAERVWAHTNKRLTNLADTRAARIDEITAARMAELDAAGLPTDTATLLGRLTAARALLMNNLANLDATISSRLSLAAFDLKIPDARAARIDLLEDADYGLAQLLRTISFNRSEFETEWSTDPVVQNVQSAAETALTAGSITPTYPTGAVERRAILLPMIKAASQAANTHHTGIKIQYRTGGAGPWSDLLNLTANPPLALVAVDGAVDSWAHPVDVTAIVSSGVQAEFRFAVDSDNAGSVNYTTNFILALVYRMG